MKATIVDLRYKMNDVLKALDRKEEVTILYRGKVKGRITPAINELSRPVVDHPFFGMNKANKDSVQDEINRLRSPRVDAI